MQPFRARPRAPSCLFRNVSRECSRASASVFRCCSPPAGENVEKRGTQGSPFQTVREQLKGEGNI